MPFRLPEGTLAILASATHVRCRSRGGRIALDASARYLGSEITESIVHPYHPLRLESQASTGTSRRAPDPYRPFPRIPLWGGSLCDPPDPPGGDLDHWQPEGHGSWRAPPAPLAPRPSPLPGVRRWRPSQPLPACGQYQWGTRNPHTHCVDSASTSPCHMP